jgi:hypothetical protein
MIIGRQPIQKIAGIGICLENHTGRKTCFYLKQAHLNGKGLNKNTLGQSFLLLTVSGEGQQSYFKLFLLNLVLLLGEYFGKKEK